VVSRQNLCNISISLNQRRSVNLIRELQGGNSFLERMQTSEDYVKYYYFVPPTTATNYTATVTVTPKTPGFFPSFYAQRNDLLNLTWNYKSLSFPSIRQNSFAQEQLFFYPAQSSYSFSFNCSAVSTTLQQSFNLAQNMTVNQTVQVNVSSTFYNTTSKKNQTVWSMQN
jgi:hypothetical protein